MRFPWILVGFAGLELDESASGAVGDGDGDFAVGVNDESGGAIGFTGGEGAGGQFGEAGFDERVAITGWQMVFDFC
ncbi:MAG: hypothetical protein RL095_3585 [Verrucomicrobiota bacterium]